MPPLASRIRVILPTVRGGTRDLSKVGSLRREDAAPLQSGSELQSQLHRETAVLDYGDNVKTGQLLRNWTRVSWKPACAAAQANFKPTPGFEGFIRGDTGGNKVAAEGRLRFLKLNMGARGSDV